MLLEVIARDPAAAQDEIVLVKHAGLARCDGSLGLFQGDGGLVSADRANDSWRAFVVVADLGEGLEFFLGMLKRNPIAAFDAKRVLDQIVGITDDDLVFVWVKPDDVEGFGGGDAEALTLTNRVELDAVVRAEHFPL